MSQSDWVHIRSPFVYWAQTETGVSLRVDIRNAQAPRIQIDENKVTFDSTGEGAFGESEYHFEIIFAHEINPKESSYRILDRDVNINIQKATKGWWAKLSQTHKKPAWLKIDFDRWKSPDDEDELPGDIMRDYPDIFKTLQRNEIGHRVENLRHVYLFMFNLFQFVGYLYILGVLTIRFLKDGPVAFHHAYDLTGFALCYCQIVQFVEIIHPMLGFTKTSVRVALLQVAGRAAILFLIIVAETRMHTKPIVFFLFYIWSLADVIRYPYYMVQLSKRNIHALTWLRYSAWIILYPAGIACEAVVIFASIPYFMESQKYSITLPNQFNFTFSFANLLRMYLLFGMFPIAYALLQNMKRARVKALEDPEKQRIKKRRD